MKPSVLVAVGCSWVAGKSIDTDPLALTHDFDHIEDPVVVAEHSFAGRLQRQLGLDQLHFIARHGASNQEQVRKLIDFVESHKNEYSQIFVLWGITSIYRWEMYSNSTESIEPCLYGRLYKDQNLQEESKYYFKHFWNKEYELEKLGNNVVMLDAYLTAHNIEHLFFNSFHGYTGNDLNVAVGDNIFYRVKENNNDMLSFLCVKHKVKLSNSSVPWLNLLKPTIEQQYNNRAIKDLQAQGLLDCATAHPTIKAHADIADELYNYIRG